ncbi:hypothetical protein TKK_0019348 [Trichogramma kaykai]
MDENQLQPDLVKLGPETAENSDSLDVNSLSIQELTDKFILSAEHERLHSSSACKKQTLTDQELQKMYHESATVKQTHDEHMKIMKMARKSSGTKFSHGSRSTNLKMVSEDVNGKSLHKKDSTNSKVNGESFQSSYELYHDFENPYSFVDDEGFNESLHKQIFEPQKRKGSLLNTKPIEECRNRFPLVIKQLKNGINFKSFNEVHESYCKLLDEVEKSLNSNDDLYFNVRKNENQHNNDVLAFYLARSVIDYSLAYFSSNCIENPSVE